MKDRFANWTSRGEILELMCGWRTFVQKTKANRVYGLDSSKRALRQYPHIGVRFDLNQLALFKKLPFKSERFQVVTICMGYKYPANIAAVFEEVIRIITPGGTLLMFEHTSNGFSFLKHREFDPNTCATELRARGFYPEVQMLPLTTKHGDDAYYFIQALKIH